MEADKHQLAFGIRLKLIRKTNKLTAESMAKYCDTSKEAILRWEKGGYPKDIAALCLTLRDVFGVDHRWLMFGDEFIQYLSEDEKLKALLMELIGEQKIWYAPRDLNPEPAD